MRILQYNPPRSFFSGTRPKNETGGKHRPAERTGPAFHIDH